jgi:hypothetical protein
MNTESSSSVSTKQRRIAELAEYHGQEGLSTLGHYLDLPWMKEADGQVRRDSAPGVDGKSVADYGRALEENLGDLIGRAKTGSYVAPPVRRVHIPKGDGKETRPIGMPTARPPYSLPCPLRLLGGGKNTATGGRDAAGAHLREGVLRLLVWLSAWALRASGVEGDLAGDQPDPEPVGGGCGHPGVL